MLALCGFGLGGFLRSAGASVSASLLNGLPEADCQTDHQRSNHRRAGSERQLVPANQFLEAIEVAGRTGNDRLIVQVPLYVRRQAVGGFVAAGAVFLQALHCDPIQVAAHNIHEFGSLQAAAQRRTAARPPKSAVHHQGVGVAGTAPG